MKPSVAIVTDSMANISLEDQKKFNNSLFSLPFSLLLPNQETAVNIDTGINDDQFYQFLQRKEILKTTQTNPQLVINLWKKLTTKFNYIVHLGIGSRYSGQNQMLNTLLKQHPSWQNKITVIDSKLLSYPLKMLVFEACKFFQKQFDIPAFLDLQNDFLDSLFAYGFSTDVEFMEASGRIPTVISKFLKTTKLIPIMFFKNHKIKLFKTTRTIKKGLQFILDQLRPISDVIFLSYCRKIEPDFIPLIFKLLKKYKFKDIIVQPLSRPTICHSGTKTVAFFVLDQHFISGRGSKNRTRDT